MISIRFEALSMVPVGIAVAAGREMVPSLSAAARAAWFTRLVTDSLMAVALLAIAGDRAL